MSGFYRDHTISFWEVWHRDVRIADCMEAAGLVYEPEVMYPESTIVELAERLDVAPVPFDASAGTSADPAVRNAEIRQRMSPEQLDVYYRTLNGESAADMTYMEETQLVPPGRPADSFAIGGCYGQADSEPSVWDLKNTLMPQLDELREQARQTPEFEAHLQSFTACWDSFGFPEVTSPRQVDELYLREEGAPADDMQSACDEYWTAAEMAGKTAVEPLFLKEHRQQLEAQLSRYEFVSDQIMADTQYLEFLGVRAGECIWTLEQDAD